MPLKESYVIWNNKGGVGKSTLTFHLATRYAKQNPTESVLVIDLCPQANVSMALLHEDTHLSNLCKGKKTVSSYLHDRFLEHGQTVKACDFLTQVKKLNNQVPGNLYLLCGDMYLELVGRCLEGVRSRAVSPGNNPWFNVTSSMRSFIEDSPNGVTQSQSQWVVFIDTNPSFAVYTEIALAAARKLLIPMNADDFSVEAVRAMLDLVYGIHEDQQALQHLQAYREYMFSYKAESYGLRRPEIHVLINNRTTVYQSRSAAAFTAMREEILEVLFEAYDKHQQQKKCFVQQDGQGIPDKNAFKQRYFVDVPDFHTTAVLCLHAGCPLEALSGKIAFQEAGSSVKVDKKRVRNCLEWLDELVQKL